MCNVPKNILFRRLIKGIRLYFVTKFMRRVWLQSFLTFFSNIRFLHMAWTLDRCSLFDLAWWLIKTSSNAFHVFLMRLTGQSYQNKLCHIIACVFVVWFGMRVNKNFVQGIEHSLNAIDWSKSSDRALSHHRMREENQKATTTATAITTTTTVAI